MPLPSGLKTVLYNMRGLLCDLEASIFPGKVDIPTEAYIAPLFIAANLDLILK
jgi:hypothetical protein